jgi:hypothetical protein
MYNEPAIGDSGLFSTSVNTKQQSRLSDVESRYAQVQCTDCIQPCDSELSKCSVRDSPLRPLFPGAAVKVVIGTKS